MGIALCGRGVCVCSGMLESRTCSASARAIWSVRGGGSPPANPCARCGVWGLHPACSSRTKVRGAEEGKGPNHGSSICWVATERLWMYCWLFGARGSWVCAKLFVISGDAWSSMSDLILCACFCTTKWLHSQDGPAVSGGLGLRQRRVRALQPQTVCHWRALEIMVVVGGTVVGDCVIHFEQRWELHPTMICVCSHLALVTWRLTADPTADGPLKTVKTLSACQIHSKVDPKRWVSYSPKARVDCRRRQPCFVRALQIHHLKCKTII